MTDLGTLPGGLYSYATDINNRGDVVGVSNSAAGGDRGVLWARGTITDLGVPLGGGVSSAFAINSRGQIAGQRITATGVGHAVVWTIR